MKSQSLPFSVAVSSPSVFVPEIAGAVHVPVLPLLDPPLDDPPLLEPPLDDPPLEDPPLDEPPELEDVVSSSSPPVSSLGSVLAGDFVGCGAGVVLDSSVQAARIEATAKVRSRRMKHSLVMKEQPASDEARPQRIHRFLLP